MNDCDHECVRCRELFTHAPRCDNGSLALCWSCERLGFVLRECSVCREVTAFKHGWACDKCVKERKVVA